MRISALNAIWSVFPIDDSRVFLIISTTTNKITCMWIMMLMFKNVVCFSIVESCVYGAQR